MSSYTFDEITEDGRLWAVRNEHSEDNVLSELFDFWNDVMALRDFFISNSKDLYEYYDIQDIDQAISDTIEDSGKLEDMFLNISSDTSLEEVFRPLENYRTGDTLLGKEKARPSRYGNHKSWLRVYAIKLTRTMQERPHTNMELTRLDQVRNFLLAEGIIDDDAFVDYVSVI